MASKAAIEQCAKALYEKVRSAWNNPGQDLLAWLSDLQTSSARQDFSVKDCETVARKATEMLHRDEVYPYITHHTGVGEHYFLATWPGPPES